MTEPLTSHTLLRAHATGRGVSAHLVTTEHHAEEARTLAASLELPGGRAGCTCCLYVAGEPTELPALARAAARAAKQDGILIAVGGDGSINTVAQAAWEADVPMSALACGTFNFFAREHGLPDDPVEAAGAILDALENGQPKPVHVGRVNERIFLVNASLGLYPRILVEREQASRRFGRHQLVALISAVVTLARGVRRKLLTISTGLPDAVIHNAPTHATTLFVGRNALQLDQLGMPETREVANGALGVILHLPESRWSLASMLFRAARGALAEHPSIQSFAAHAFEVAPARGAGRQRILVACDGETMPMRLPLNFSVETRPLRLIAPHDPLAEVRRPQAVGRAA